MVLGEYFNMIFGVKRDLSNEPLDAGEDFRSAKQESVASRGTIRQSNQACYVAEGKIHNPQQLAESLGIPAKYIEVTEQGYNQQFKTRFKINMPLEELNRLRTQNMQSQIDAAMRLRKRTEQLVWLKKTVPYARAGIVAVIIAAGACIYSYKDRIKNFFERFVN